jgi:hypothetical protein
LSLDFHGALLPRLWVEFPFSDASSPSTTIARAKVVAITCWPPNRYLFSDQEKLLMAETEDSSRSMYRWSGAAVNFSRSISGAIVGLIHLRSSAQILLYVYSPSSFSVLA